MAELLGPDLDLGGSLAALTRLAAGPIVDAIAQHHGTTVATAIYHKARKAAQEAASVVRPLNADAAPVKAPTENDFRYKNPKPNSRESAIISLADAVESAARSLPTAAPKKR